MTPSRALLIKLGGSLLTDKEVPETAHFGRIDRLARELVAASAIARERGERIVLGHGSGSFGHVAAAAAGLGRGPVEASALAGASRTQEQAAALHRIVIDALARAGLAPFSFAPSSFVVAEAGRPAASFLEPLARALEAGLLPVVYGDVVLDRSWTASICSTEAALTEVARGLPAFGIGISRALWLGETDGVYDVAGRTIPCIADLDDPALGSGALGTSRGTDVTGGMRLRVETCLALAALDIPSTILDGRPEGSLLAAVRGDDVSGTRIG